MKVKSFHLYFFFCFGIFQMKNNNIPQSIYEWFSSGCILIWEMGKINLIYKLLISLYSFIYLLIHIVVKGEVLLYLFTDLICLMHLMNCTTVEPPCGKKEFEMYYGSCRYRSKFLLLFHPSSNILSD